jgi:hypothetical protein
MGRNIDAQCREARIAETVAQFAEAATKSNKWGTRPMKVRTQKRKVLIRRAFSDQNA